MSVTTSTNTVTQNVLHALTDYDVHHSGNPAVAETPEAPNSRNDTAVGANQPPNWPSNYQRVPAYRPIDRTLNNDPEERPAGSNAIEGLFIFTMLNGCRINSNMARLWRSTGGRINDRIFHYKIGGEI